MNELANEPDAVPDKSWLASSLLVLGLFSAIVALITTSCATEKPKDIEGWAGSAVFMLPKEVRGFQSETLELKDGKFRYWFSSDFIDPNPPKYPIEGTYELKGDRLLLSSGKNYTVRALRGVRSLWRPAAVDYWDHHQIIDSYGILLPVDSIKSEKPPLELLFTKEQWKRSGLQVLQLNEKK